MKDRSMLHIFFNSLSLGEKYLEDEGLRLWKKLYKCRLYRTFFVIHRIWFQNNHMEDSLRICTFLEQVIALNECEVYSYMPDVEGDPFADVGTM